MNGFERRREDVGERVKERSDLKLRAIELVYGLEMKLVGFCGDCKKKYDLTECLLGKDNGAVNFAVSCFNVSSNREIRRTKAIFDSRKCWQQLKCKILFRNIGEEEFSECDFVKAPVLRQELLTYRYEEPEKIKEKKPNIFFSVIFNYGSLTRAFADCGYEKKEKYKLKWKNYDELVNKMCEAGVTDEYISWILGVDKMTAKRRRYNKEKTS